MNHVWKIIKFTSNLWRYYLAVSFFSILIASIGLLVPFLSGRAIDILKTNPTEVKSLTVIVIIIFLVDVLTTVISNYSGFLGDVMATKLQRILSYRYYQHLLDLPQEYYDKELSGKIVNRLNRSIAQITNFMQMWSNNFLQFIFSTVLSLAIIAYFSWQIALLLFSLYPIYIFMTIKTSSKWLKFQSKINKHWDVATGRFAEGITQMKVVKSFVREATELKHFNKNYLKIIGVGIPQSKHWHKRDVERRLILNVIFLGVYLLIFHQASRGQFTPGQAVTLILYAMQIRIPIFTVSFLVDNTQRAISDSKDYFAVMDEPILIMDKVGAKKLTVKEGQIEFDNILFSYGKKPVIKQMSFDVKAGSRVALVGESGEGKTTLTNLLMRFYEPQSGSIFVDGQNIADITQKSLRHNIGAVFQDPALFSGTIRENIAYAKPNAQPKDIEIASRAANAHDFIIGFEDGYETEIGERGLKLSGGQKQRIAIARAILKDAPILILDEATSSLDSKSEQMVQEALERLMKGRTTIIVAHRLSTIQNVDTIITLRKGCVDEIGSPAKLAKSGGIYDQLLEIQSSKNKEISNKKLQVYDLTAS